MNINTFKKKKIEEFEKFGNTAYIKGAKRVEAKEFVSQLITDTVKEVCKQARMSPAFGCSDMVMGYNDAVSNLDDRLDEIEREVQE